MIAKYLRCRIQRLEVANCDIQFPDKIHQTLVRRMPLRQPFVIFSLRSFPLLFIFLLYYCIGFCFFLPMPGRTFLSRRCNFRHLPCPSLVSHNQADTKYDNPHYLTPKSFARGNYEPFFSIRTSILETFFNIARLIPS